MASTSKPAKCRLLDLAPELRNRIHEYALWEAKPIEVTRNNWMQPPLLKTCKTIRSEAMGIYYCENEFWFHAENFDPSLAQNFYRYTSKFYDDSKVLISIEHVDRNAWPNFLKWLKAHYEGVLPLYFTYDSEYDDTRFNTAAKAFDILRDLKNAGNTWSTIEKVLESYKVLTAELMLWDSD